MIVVIKDNPELLRVIRAVDSVYRKPKCIVNVATDCTLQGTYCDGGSRSTYTAVNLSDMRSSGAPQYAPAQYGGPMNDPRVDIPVGVVIVRTGTFCGKKATATIYMHPDNVAKLLPNDPM